MSRLETTQREYKVLKTLGADDTALVWSGANQTVDKHEDRHSSIESDDIPQSANGAIVIFHGTDAANESMDWMLIGWRQGGPAEHIAYGTALLGTQRVATGTATGLYADSITITGQTWLTPISLIDHGNNRIAKLAFDLCGLAHIAAVCDNSGSGGTATTGAKISYF